MYSARREKLSLRNNALPYLSLISNGLTNDIFTGGDFILIHQNAESSYRSSLVFQAPQDHALSSTQIVWKLTETDMCGEFILQFSCIKRRDHFEIIVHTHIEHTFYSNHWLYIKKLGTCWGEITTSLIVIKLKKGNKEGSAPYRPDRKTFKETCNKARNSFFLRGC